MVERLRVALLFGGRSAEHDVSVLSAGNVFRALDPARYETVPIGITRSGTWLLCSIEGGKFPTAVPESGPRVALIPGGSGRLAILPETDGAAPDLTRAVDVVFPVLHGPFGEDGTVQGLAEIAGVALCRLGRARLGRGDGQGCRQTADARRRPADRALPELRPRRRAVIRSCRRRNSAVRCSSSPRGSARRSASARRGRGRSSLKPSPRRSGTTARSWSRNLSAAARSSAACSRARTGR